LSCDTNQIPIDRRFRGTAFKVLSGNCDRPVTPLARWRWWALAFVILVTALVRLWFVHHMPEPDGDAKGHLGIAEGVLADPTNVRLHWVWLPAYHYLLALMLGIGLSANAIRTVNCVLAAAVPVLVLRYGERTAGAGASGISRYAPWMAAMFCAISPLVNLLGTSAQQETLFTILVLGTAWSIDEDRYGLAGALLAVASMVRYEAWGAVVLLIGLRVVGLVPAIAKRMPVSLARAARLPLVVVVPSLVAIGGWFLAHRLQGASWFGSLRELYRYAHVQRGTFVHDTVEDLLWFPVKQPLFMFGWIVVALFFAGLRRVARPSWVVPLGVYAFLIGAYSLKATLGSARYYESVTPFVALAAAYSACAIGERHRRVAVLVFALASWQLVSLSDQLFAWTWPSSAGLKAVITKPADADGSSAAGHVAKK
jgi:hypothetical protein